MNRHIPSFFDKQGLQLLLLAARGSGQDHLRHGRRVAPCRTSAGAFSVAGFHRPGATRCGTVWPATRPPAICKCSKLDAQQCLTRFREQNGGMLREIAAAGTFLDDEDINQFPGISLCPVWTS